MSAPDQERLRAELHAAAERSAGASVDLDTVLEESRRARRRRRNGIAGGATAVAALVAAIGLTGVLSEIQGPVATTADAPAFEAPASNTESSPADGARESAVAPRDGDQAGDLALGSLAQLNRCGEPVVPATDATASPLLVEVDVDDVLLAGGSANAVVTVMNTGETDITGAFRSTPSIAVVEDGSVVWLSNEAAAGAATEPVELAPGESAEFMAPVEARVCSSHGGRLPSALAPGEYAVSASVVFVPAGEEGSVLQLVSPVAPLTVE
jgi:hypothetical protein